MKRWRDRQTDGWTDTWKGIQTNAHRGTDRRMDGQTHGQSSATDHERLSARSTLLCEMDGQTHGTQNDGIQGLRRPLRPWTVMSDLVPDQTPLRNDGTTNGRTGQMDNPKT